MILSQGAGASIPEKHLNSKVTPPQHVVFSLYISIVYVINTALSPRGGRLFSPGQKLYALFVWRTKNSFWILSEILRTLAPRYRLDFCFTYLTILNNDHNRLLIREK